MYLRSVEEHLGKNFKAAEAAFMRRVLDVCSRAAGGEQLDTILARMGQPPTVVKRKALRDATNILVADGYLMAEPDGDRIRYRFRSGLLRRYWQRYLAE